MPTPTALYHYCSNDAFVSVVNSRSVWLSSLTLSNDSMEGRLVNATVMRVAERDKLDVNSQQRLRESLEFSERFFDGLGFCLSEEGDLLSQWRGYADDARGVAIGFGKTYLDALAVTSKSSSAAGFVVHKVEYEPTRQEALVEPTYAEIRKLIAAGAFRRPGLQSLLDSRTQEQIGSDDKEIQAANRELIIRLRDFLPMLFQLKAEAFREEREWRLVSMLGGRKFEDCLFRSSRGKIIPYRSFQLQDLGRPPITDVVLGAKNETPTPVVESMLAQAGLTDVRVWRSRSTYR